VKVQVLLDNGSSDNFLQPRIAHCLKLAIEPTSKFQVLVGNGNSLIVEGMVRDVEVQIQRHSLKLPVYLLPVSGADVVLGAAWLATLDSHIADYSDLALKFLVDGNFVTLHGDKPKLSAPAQYNHLRRMQRTHAISKLFTLQFQQPNCDADHWLKLPENMEPELALLLHTYHDVFTVPMGLPRSRSNDHCIPLIKRADPVKVRPYRYSHSQKEEIEKIVSDMLQEGIIVPSTSPFSSPIVLVKKKYGTWRFCTDYRALNAITVKDSFPIHIVDELIDELFGAQYFSNLDLRSSYHQILLKKEDRYKTAFRTHHGHYEWLVMPFVLMNAPATFQCLMNEVFQDMLRKSILVYFYDILVYSPTWSSHLQHLKVVLQLLRKHKLFAKLLSKCSFGLTQVEYLGHTVSGQGVAVDAFKVQAVLAWSLPTNLKQLWGFLGLTGYYRKFIKGYASIVAPLTNLLMKDNFNWDVDATVAFETLNLP